MLRSLFLKNWCRTAVKTTACAVTFSSALVFSHPAMAASIIVLGDDTTAENPTFDLASSANADIKANADGSGYTIEVGDDECAISSSHENGTPLPTHNTINVGADSEGKLKTLYVVGNATADYTDPDYDACACVSMSAGVTNGYELTINGNLVSTFTGGRIMTSQGVIVVNEQAKTDSPIHLTITGDVKTTITDMNISRSFDASYGVGITDGSFTVGGDFELTMSNISDWDTSHATDAKKADLRGLCLGTGGADATRSATQYTFENNLTIHQVQHVSNRDAVVYSQMIASGIYMDATAVDWDTYEEAFLDRTMTVKENLTVQKVSVAADGSSAESVWFSCHKERGFY